MFHYVYRITCLITKLHYYGVRSCKILPEVDLKKYRSSSKVVHQAIKTFGIQNFKFKIVRKFSNRADAMTFECFLHEKFKVDSNQSFMNLSRNRSNRAFYSAHGVTNNSWGKKMMYLDKCVIFVEPKEILEFQKKGYTLGRPSWLKQPKRYGENNHFFGRKHSDSTKEILSKKRSIPVVVHFLDGKIIQFRNRMQIGTYLGMSTSLGCSLVSRKRCNIFEKYGILKIEVNNENILYKKGSQ